MDESFVRGAAQEYSHWQHATPAGAARPRGAGPGSKTGAALEAELRWLLMARRMRDTTFGAELFADPAWDILVELYAAALGQRRVSTSELCVRSAVPATTALRWIGKLEEAGLVTRVDDVRDGRRTWVEISAAAQLKIESYFHSIGGVRSVI